MSDDIMTGLEPLIYFMFIFAVAVTIFAFVAQHDSPIATENSNKIRIDYVSKITPNTTGTERIQFAKEVCTDAYLDRTYSDRMWSGHLIFQLDVDRCVNELIKGIN